MLILTHQGPGFRSKLMGREAALARAAQLREDPQYQAVTTLESNRSQHPTNRFFVVCLPASEEKRQALLEQFQQERIERAEKEGPRYLWVADPDQPVWHLLSLGDEPYVVDQAGAVCSCRDAGVCRDNGLLCKHLAALQLGLGLFVPAEQFQRLQFLAAKLQQPAPERQPVAVPVAA
jgi:hypothetical protein